MVPQAQQDLAETLVNQVNKDPLDLSERREKSVWLDLVVSLVPRERWDPLDHQDQLEQQDPKESRESLDKLAQEEHVDHKAVKDSKDRLGTQAKPDDQERRETKVCQETLDQEVLKVPVDYLVPPDQRDKLVTLDRQVDQASLAVMERLDHQEPTEKMVHKDQLVSEEWPDSQEKLEFQES